MSALQRLVRLLLPRDPPPWIAPSPFEAARLAHGFVQELPTGVPAATASAALRNRMDSLVGIWPPGRLHDATRMTRAVETLLVARDAVAVLEALRLVPSLPQLLNAREPLCGFGMPVEIEEIAHKGARMWPEPVPGALGCYGCLALAAPEHAWAFPAAADKNSWLALPMLAVDDTDYSEARYEHARAKAVGEAPSPWARAVLNSSCSPDLCNSLYGFLRECGAPGRPSAFITLHDPALHAPVLEERRLKEGLPLLAARDLLRAAEIDIRSRLAECCTRVLEAPLPPPAWPTGAFAMLCLLRDSVLGPPEDRDAPQIVVREPGSVIPLHNAPRPPD